MARRLKPGRLLDRAPSRERDLCLAMITQQALKPASELQTVRSLAQSTLGSELGIAGADEDEATALQARALDLAATAPRHRVVTSRDNPSHARKLRPSGRSHRRASRAGSARP